MGIAALPWLLVVGGSGPIQYPTNHKGRQCKDAEQQPKTANNAPTQSPKPCCRDALQTRLSKPRLPHRSHHHLQSLEHPRRCSPRRLPEPKRSPTWPHHAAGQATQCYNRWKQAHKHATMSTRTTSGALRLGCNVPLAPAPLGVEASLPLRLPGEQQAKVRTVAMAAGVHGCGSKVGHTRGV